MVAEESKKSTTPPLFFRRSSIGFGLGFTLGILFSLLVFSVIGGYTFRHHLTDRYASWWAGKNDEWKAYNGHVYRVTPMTCEWQEAENWARNLNGHLIAINDPEENAWAMEMFGDKGPLWIGCTDEIKEGEWRWTTGEPFDYENWHGGEPNNAYRGLRNNGRAKVVDFEGGEDYGIINYNGRHKWNDLGKNLGPQWANLRGLVEIPRPPKLSGSD